MEIKTGEYREVQFEGQLRIIKVLSSIDKNPGYWLVEDVLNHSQFEVATSGFDPALFDETPDDETPEGEPPVNGEPSEN